MLNSWCVVQRLRSKGKSPELKLAVRQEEHLPSQRRCYRSREDDTEYISVMV